MATFDRTTFRRPLSRIIVFPGPRKPAGPLLQEKKSGRICPLNSRKARTILNSRGDQLFRITRKITDKFNFAERELYENNIERFKDLPYATLEPVEVADDHVYSLDVRCKEKDMIAFTILTKEGIPDDFNDWEGFHPTNNLMPLIKKAFPSLNYNKFRAMYFIGPGGLANVVLQESKELKEEEILFAAKLFCIFNKIPKFLFRGREIQL